MNTSYKVVELVKSKIGTEYLKASDADAAKVLCVSRTSVSNYKGGRDVMSIETLAKAQDILKLETSHILQLAVELQMDGAKEPNHKKLWSTIRTYVVAFRGKAAGVLLAGAVAMAPADDTLASGNAAFSAHSPAGSVLPTLYIMLN